MKPKNLFLGLLTGTLLVGSTLGEVRLVGGGGTQSRLVVYGTPSDPDPHVQTWTVLINTDPSVLNPQGDANGDGSPSFGLSLMDVPVPPVFTWARQVAPGNHDPVYSQFVEGAWTTPIPIMTDPGDDLDPRWMQDAGGTIHAVWWRAGAGAAGGEVLYASRVAGSGSFSAAERVSRLGEAARAPAILVLPAGEVLVAYETDLAGGTRNIVVASKAAPPSVFQQETVAMSSHPGDATVELRSNADHTWVTWIDAEDCVDHVERVNGTWTSLAHESCAGPEDVDRARLRILSGIVGP